MGFLPLKNENKFLKNSLLPQRLRNLIFIEAIVWKKYIFFYYNCWFYYINFNIFKLVVSASFNTVEIVSYGYMFPFDGAYNQLKFYINAISYTFVVLWLRDICCLLFSLWKMSFNHCGQNNFWKRVNVNLCSDRRSIFTSDFSLNRWRASFIAAEKHTAKLSCPDKTPDQEHGDGYELVLMTAKLSEKVSSKKIYTINSFTISGQVTTENTKFGYKKMVINI